MTYCVNYEDFRYPKFVSFPDRQRLTKPVSVQTAFAVVAEMEARAFIKDGQFDGGYTIAPIQKRGKS